MIAATTEHPGNRNEQRRHGGKVSSPSKLEISFAPHFQKSVLILQSARPCTRVFTESGTAEPPSETKNVPGLCAGHVDNHIARFGLALLYEP